MAAYMITYFISDTTGHSHDHDENCGCGGDHTHSHDHDENCGCGEDHAHSHEHTPSSNGNIIGKIKSLGAWAQFLPEGFFVKADSTAEEIFAEVSSVANKGDIIFVTKVDATSSACANPAVLAWLAK